MISSVPNAVDPGKNRPFESAHLPCFNLVVPTASRVGRASFAVVVVVFVAASSDVPALCRVCKVPIYFE